MIDQETTLGLIVGVELRVKALEEKFDAIEKRLAAVEGLDQRFRDVEFKQRILDDHIDTVANQIQTLDGRLRSYGIRSTLDESSG